MLKVGQTIRLTKYNPDNTVYDQTTITIISITRYIVVLIDNELGTFTKEADTLVDHWRQTGYRMEVIDNA